MPLHQTPTTPKPQWEREDQSISETNNERQMQEAEDLYPG